MLVRVFDSDHLARVVPDLAPEVLHHVILHRGLEACGDLIAAATAEQLTSLFDLDLWQAEKPGLAEQLDIRRFGEWVEVLVDQDPSLAARTVAAVDPRLVIAALSRYIRVFDPGIFERIVPTEEVDHDLAPDPFTGLTCEMAGYIVRARRTDVWDAIVLLLHALADEQPERFDEVMLGCRRLSNDAPEMDGLDDLLDAPHQAVHDAALEREGRRSEQGYVTPGDARAFLEMARRSRQAQQPPDQSQRNPPQQNLPQPQPTQQPSAAARPAIGGHDDSSALIERPDAGESSGTRIGRAMRHLAEHDPDAFDERLKELAFLAGALVAGCSLGDRPFTPREARDAAIAICNIGLEHWPGIGINAGLAGGIDASMPDDVLRMHELVAVFEAGWAVLHEQVSLFVADSLIATLRDLRGHDSDTRRGLIALERKLIKHRSGGTPWHAREALDVLAILDMAAWTTLLGLLGECPVMPAALVAIVTRDITPIDAEKFEFISTADHLRMVRAFMRQLPRVLTS